MSDVYAELGRIARHLEDEGILVTQEGTSGVPVLYNRTDRGTIIGIDTETVCLYLDKGADEMPVEILAFDHEMDLEDIYRITRMLRDARVPLDTEALLTA